MGEVSTSKSSLYSYLLFRLVRNCKQKLDLLIEKGIRPIIVFDGNKLKAKDDVEK